ncbi:MAG: hypothetical protein ACO3E1_10420 [Flavobacteriales bacterium]
MIEFNKKGFPIIKLHDEHFEIKAIDYWEFRSFKYSEVNKIEFSNETEMAFHMPLLSIFLSRNEPHRLKFFKNNGADWEYLSSPKVDNEFVSIINEIKKRCGLNFTK